MQESNFFEYLNSLRLRYSGDSEKVLLLKTGSILYPLYIANGMTRCGPILIRCYDECQAMRIAQELNLFSANCIVSLADTPKSVERAMKNGDFDVRIFVFHCGRYVNQNLELIKQYTLYGNDPVLSLVIADSSGAVGYSEYFDGEINIDVDENLNKRNGQTDLDDWLARNMITYTLERGKAIERWSRECDEIRGIEAFQISKNVLCDFAISQGADNDFLKKFENHLESALIKIESDWEGTDETEFLSNLFCQKLLDASGWIPYIINRNMVPLEKWENVSEDIWYDRSFYYLSEAQFEYFCSMVCKDASIRRLKSYLSEAGVLVLEGRSRTYGTVKVKAFNPYGAFKTERRVKLRRKFIDAIRDLTLIEMFGESEEEE